MNSHSTYTQRCSPHEQPVGQVGVLLWNCSAVSGVRLQFSNRTCRETRSHCMIEHLNLLIVQEVNRLYHVDYRAQADMNAPGTSLTESTNDGDCCLVQTVRSSGGAGWVCRCLSAKLSIHRVRNKTRLEWIIEGNSCIFEQRLVSSHARVFPEKSVQLFNQRCQRFHLQHSFLARPKLQACLCLCKQWHHIRWKFDQFPLVKEYIQSGTKNNLLM